MRLRTSLFDSTWGFGLGLILLGQGCLAQSIDPDTSGVFVCESNEDCPATQSCLQARCVVGSLPKLMILSPEEDSLVEHDAVDGDVRTIVVTLGGSDLDLVDPAADPSAAVGAGQVSVVVDGVEAVLISAGDLTGTVATEVPVTNRAGAHRIEIRALRSDGSAYDNPEATDRRVFWLNDGMPHVVIKRPWPGESIALDAVAAEVEVSAIGILLESPGTQVLPGIGHTHIYYDQAFPACAMDNICDQSYQGIVPVISGMLSSDILLPSSGAGSANITAVLREANHTAFLDADGAVVFDEVSVLRTGSNN